MAKLSQTSDKLKDVDGKSKMIHPFREKILAFRGTKENAQSQPKPVLHWDFEKGLDSAKIMCFLKRAYLKKG